MLSAQICKQSSQGVVIAVAEQSCSYRQGRGRQADVIRDFVGIVSGDSLLETSPDNAFISLSLMERLHCTICTRYKAKYTDHIYLSIQGCVFL